MNLGREGADTQRDDALDLAARTRAGEARHREAGDHQIGGERDEQEHQQGDRERAADRHSTLPESLTEAELEPNIRPASASSP